SIELPQTLTSIGESAFSGCSGLTSIIYNTDNPISFSSRDIFSSDTTDEATLYVPEDCVEVVKDLTPWNNFKNIQALPSLSISNEELSIWSGETSNLNVTVSPEEMSFGKVSVEWKSSDLSVAAIEGDSFNISINALKGGVATIDCILTWGDVWKQTLQCNVTVKDTQLVESLSLDPATKEAEEGDTFQITATVLPEDAIDKTLEWSSSDESVATVDQTGLVSVLKEGECVITAKTTDGSDLRANCYLSATSGINNISFDADETVDVYSLDGVKVRTNSKKNEALNLPAGVYLLRKGNKVKKLIIR
ncbi:MAG: Ig-like domain-containing protein, partial [Muribaculaceae bacterium]|nr:Ig-like domain-containing protein [Muribaculaceae bacterium]